MRSQRNIHGIAVYRKGELRQRGGLVLQEAAEQLEVDPWRVRRLIGDGILPACQVREGGPWLIAETALKLPEVRTAVAGRAPLTPDPNQQVLCFPWCRGVRIMRQSPVG